MYLESMEASAKYRISYFIKRDGPGGMFPPGPKSWVDCKTGGSSGIRWVE